MMYDLRIVHCGMVVVEDGGTRAAQIYNLMQCIITHLELHLMANHILFPL